MLSFAYKNKDLINQKKDEKTYIIANSVTNFSQQFLSVSVSLFNIFTDISLGLFSLFFLIILQNLSQLLPLIFVFAFTNLL